MKLTDLEKVTEELKDAYECLLSIQKEKKDYSTKIVIGKNFDGAILSGTVVYEGTEAEWKDLNKSKELEAIPCIKCSDGSVIQKL